MKIKYFEVFIRIDKFVYLNVHFSYADLYEHVLRGNFLCEKSLGRLLRLNDLICEKNYYGTDIILSYALGTSNKVILLLAILAGLSIFAMSCNDSVISSRTA